MSYETLQRRLNNNEVVILDGPMGTELQRRDAHVSEGAWGSLASVEQPDLVRQIHLDYIEAGADVITTNTAAASRERLAAAQMPTRAEELNEAAVRVAREAAQSAPEGANVAVAGSITTVPDHETTMPPSLERARRAYLEQAELLARSGVDLLVLERLQDTEHSSAALESAASTGLPIWAAFSCKLGPDGLTVQLLDDPDPTAFGRILDALPAYGVAAVNIMHTEVVDTQAALTELRRHWAGPVGAYPHHGQFDWRPHWVFGDSLTPDQLLEAAQQWHANGARIFGGCCGLGVEHIRRLAEGLGAGARRQAA